MKENNEVKRFPDIKDGIVSSCCFKKARFRILWILKEGNVDKKDREKERNICHEFLLDQHKENAREIPTFRKIIYSTYGILYPTKSWLSIPFANEEAYEVIKEIAYININKEPGESESNEDFIRQTYQENKVDLLNQIKDINPQIIIFGGTEQFFSEEDLESIEWPSNVLDRFEANADDSSYNVTCYSRTKDEKYKDKLLICPAHPAYFKVSDRDYCTSIHNAVREWVKDLNKHYL